MVVGFPHGMYNDYDIDLKKPFWKSYFVATEATINDTFFIDGRLQEGMSGSPIFIYTSDLENSSCDRFVNSTHFFQEMTGFEQFKRNLLMHPFDFLWISGTSFFTIYWNGF